MRTGLRVLLMLTMLVTMASDTTAVTKRIYHIGNSLTDQVSFSEFQGLAESRGHEHIWGRQTIPGAPLRWNWDNPGGNTRAPYGDYSTALDGWDWDALVLQPGRVQPQSEAAYACLFHNLAIRRHPQTITYVHMCWASNDPDQGSYSEQWLDPSGTPGRIIGSCREHFEIVADSLAAVYGEDAVRVIPNGEVMYEIDQRIQAGTFTALDSIWQGYSDGSHQNDTGEYIVACTHYAVIYQDDPVGLPTTGWDIAQNVATAIQEVVRDVVLAYPRAKVSSFGPYPVTGVAISPQVLELNVGRAAPLAAQVLPTNATNASLTWSCLDGGVASVSSAGLVTALGAGTARIVATTSDGGHTDTCIVAVVNTGTAVDAVVVSPDTVTVLVDESSTFTAQVLPAGATNSAVTWRSLDTTFATVSPGGVVTGTRKGLTRVVATSVNGYKCDTGLVIVTIVNTAPTPILDVTPTVGYNAAAFSFSGLRSTDPDSGDFVLGYDWDFGDGSPVSYLSNLKYEYIDTGHYTARLRVMDYNYTRSDWVEQQIVVKPSYPGVILYDGFEEQAGREVAGCVGGYGWENKHESFDASMIADDSPMSYSSLMLNGNHVVGGSGWYRRPDPSSSGTLAGYVSDEGIGAEDSTLWISMLMRKENDNDYPAYFRLNPARNDNAHSGVVELGYTGTDCDDGGTRYWSIVLDSVVTRSPVAVPYGTTTMLVARLHWSSSSVSVDLYIDPASLGGLAPASPTATATLDTMAHFRCLAFHSRNNRQGEASFDELRIGTSYAAATPTEIVTARPATDLRQAAASTVRVRTVGSTVHLSGLDEACSVELLDIAGRVVARARARSGRASVGVRAGRLYLVRVRGGGRAVAERVLVAGHAAQGRVQ